MTRLLQRRSVLASLIAVPAAAVLLSACSDSGGDGQAQAQISSSGAAPQSAGTVDMDVVLEEGALPEMVLGEADAPVTIVEYASMTCGHCASFHGNTLPTIKEKYIDTGKARLIMREFPIGERATAGFMLARCAGDKYFSMIDVLFQQQDNWAFVTNAEAPLLQIARLAGFSQESFRACLTNQELEAQVLAVRDKAGNAKGALKIEGTPTFFINGNKYSGALTVAEMSAIIDGLL